MLRWLFRSLRALPTLGLRGALQLFTAGQFGRTVKIRPRGFQAALEVRGSTSDPVVFYLIFCMHEYPVTTLEKVRWVVDAGANSGYFSVFAAHHYPEATVIAIEPEASNYQVLSRNCAAWPQIKTVQAGLWSSEGRLGISNPDAEKWSFACTAGTGQAGSEPSIRAVSVPSLMREFSISTIDVFKIDIEGGEKEVFGGDDISWLQKTRIIMIELHPGCWGTFFKALEKVPYDCRQSGENIIVLLGELAGRSGLLRAKH
ncbi:MAG: FkbM family methyltransferase [Verrucomicrobiaceae bacterium]|nr:FkbM family methyltransferase [Verrucomicrobiaceae bacterium]